MMTNGEYNFLKKFFAKNNIKTVFDVGANIGSYTDFILKLNRHTKVHCFEPNLEAFKKLKSRGFGNKVYLNNRALSNVNGKKRLYLKEGSSHSSFYQIEDGDQILSSNVILTITLDDYCKRNLISRINLLKIDTEGHELQILCGSKRMLTQQGIDVIQFEYGYAAIYARVIFKDFVDLFSKYKYKIYKIKPFGFEEVTYNMEIEHCSYANFIAIRGSLVERC